MAAKTGRTAQVEGAHRGTYLQCSRKKEKERKKKKKGSFLHSRQYGYHTDRELRELSVYLLGHFFVTLYNASVLMRFLSVWSQHSLDSYVTILHTLSRENPLNNLVHYSAFMFTNS